MGLRINTNIPSLTAQRHLQRATERVNSSMEKLATGKRFVRASDDPAGSAIYARLNAQIRGLDQAKRNMADGLGAIQTAEGSLTEIGLALERARELAVQSSNGTLASSDRTSLQNEFAQIQSLVDQLAGSTSFNGIGLLNGSQSSISLQVGAGTTAGVDTYNLTLTSATASAIGLGGLAIDTVNGATTAIAAIDSAIDSVSSQRSNFGAMQNALNARLSATDNYKINLEAAASRIGDVDIAKESAELMKAQIIQRSAIAVLAQANSQASVALSLLG